MPRRIRLSVRSRKKRSIILSQFAEVGVKCTWKSLVLGDPALDARMLMGCVVVTDVPLHRRHARAKERLAPSSVVYPAKGEPTAMKRLLLITATGLLLSIQVALAQRVYVGIAPPPVVVEHPGPILHPGWVWIGGYYRWDGAHYFWVPGRWVQPPRLHAIWVPGHWIHGAHGWYWIEGHWRG